jgi:exodeoxyribonuclease V beta subunit
LSETYLVKIQQTLEEWRDAMSTKGIGALALLVLADVDVREKFLATRDGERHLTDFNQIVEFVEDATDGQPISPRRLRELLAEIKKTDHLSNDLAARRVESDDDAVQISTIHSTKGLQYPIVIVVDMWSTWTASALRGAPAIIRRGSVDLPGSGRVMDVGYVIGKTINSKSNQVAKAAFNQLKKDGDAELKRLFYVGVTRAQHHLTVIYPTKATLALRTNLDNKGKKSDVVGCFDLPSPVGGSIYPALPASLAGLVHLGGRGHAIPMAAPTSRTALQTSAAHREVERTRDRTSFSQIKKQLEKPNIETSHAFAAEDFVRTDDEFEVAAAREEGDIETKAPPTMPLWDVPKGKDFGTALHYVFEHLDPMASDLSIEVGRVVDAHVGPAMLKGHREQLIAGLLQVLETPFGALWNDVQLRQIPKTSRLEEVRFDAMLPEGDELSVPNTKAIGDYIASVVAANDPLSEYALLLSGSEKGIPLRGTLNGSIDALLHLSSEPHKFVISDYKSNWLRDPNDEPPLERYSPENLWTAMTVNHYPLQALIYGAAAYRYLRSRGMSISEADGSILGFAYLFVRGMIGGANTPLQKTSRLDVFVGQRYGVSSWSSAPYPTFWSGLSDVLLGVR